MVDICHMETVVRTEVKPVSFTMKFSGLRALRPYGVNFVEPDICELEWNRYGAPITNEILQG
jgi:hypothetical protein